MRRSRIVPALGLIAMLAPMIPRAALADAPDFPTPSGTPSAGQATLGATESSATSDNGLAHASVDPSTGAFHVAVPFALPAARGAIQPQLALSYSSSPDYGVGGRGWTLNLPSIERHNPSGPPQFANDPGIGNAADPTMQDHFTFGGEQLVEVCYIASGGGCVDVVKGNSLPRLLPGELLPSFVTTGTVGWHYYRLQTETGELARFFWSEDHTRWIVQYKSGETAVYGMPLGATGDAPSLDLDGVGNIYRWNLVERYDAQRLSSGDPANPVLYTWTRLPSGVPTISGAPELGYLTDIYDTAKVGDASYVDFAHHTHLVYTPSAWSPSQQTRIWLAQPTNVLSRVDVASQDFTASGARQQVRRYYLTYTSRTAGTTDGPPSLASVQLEGNCVGAGTSSGALTLANNYETGGQLPDPSKSSACPRRPPVAFSYAAPQTSPTTGALEATPAAVAMPSLSGSLKAPTIFDINNDGLPDVLDVGAVSPVVWLNEGTSSFASQPLSLASSNSPGDLTKVSQLTPSASLATGAFQLDGRLDMMWGSITKSTTPSASSTPCPQYGLPTLYCENQVQYSLLNASAANGQWTLTPALIGTYPLRPESGDFPYLGFGFGCDGNGAILGPTNIAVPFGLETPIDIADVNGDGVADMISQIVWEYDKEVDEGSGGDCLYQSIWSQYVLHLSKRAFDDTYWPFYGAAASAPTLAAPIDVCIGGVDSRSQIPSSGNNVFGDLDGDGLTDLVQFTSTGSTWWPGHGDGVFGACAGGGLDCPCTAAQGVALGVSGPSGSLQAVHDVTGDGLGDIIITAPGELRILGNRGVPGTTPSFDYPIEVNVNSLAGWPGAASPTAVYFADMNASGIDDIIVQEAPQGTTSPTALAYVDLLTNLNGSPDLRPGLLTDINNNQGSTTHVAYETLPDLAKQAAAIQPWTKHSPQPLHTVSALTTTDGLGDSYTTSYTYWDPVFDGHDNQFLGFTRVRQTTPGAATALMNTETTYFYGACGADQPVACTTGVDYPAGSYRGLPVLTEVFDGSSARHGDYTSAVYLSTTHHSYASSVLYAGADGRQVRRIYEQQTDTLLYEDNPFNALHTTLSAQDVDLPGYPAPGIPQRGASMRHLQRTASLDTFGNVSTITDRGDIGTPDPVVVKLTTWFVPPTTDPSNNWIWRAETSTISDPATGYTRQSSQQYDAHGNATDMWAVLTGTQPLSRSAFGAKQPPGASKDGTVHLKHVTYDTAGTGQPTRVQRFPSWTTNVATGRCTEYIYDAAYTQLLTTASIDIGDCGSASQMVTQHGYDRVLGVETFTVAPGGERSAAQFDGFSRPISTLKPDAQSSGVSDVATVIQYTDTSYGQIVHVQQVGGTQTGSDGSSGTTYALVDAYVYKDGLGRTIQVVSSGDTAQQWVLSSQVTRDARGRVTAAFVPTFVTAATGAGLPIEPATTASRGVTYDAFGRTLTMTDIDGSATSTNVYHALSVDQYDAETVSTSGPHAGAFATVTRDGHGRTISAVKRGNAGAITTQLTYQATGEVTSLSRLGSDSAGPVTYLRRMTYDSLGRLTVNAEPNASSDPLLRSGNSAYWLYAYDDLGDLVGSSDPRACGENIAYDGAGRALSEDYSPCDAVNQPTYTTPSATAGSGDGTEVFYVYEGTSLQTGRLSDVYDRASHSRFVHDGRGRVTEVDRQIANPGTPTSALLSRYSPTVFTALTGYDDQDRVTTQSTGADVADLQSSSATYAARFGPSTVATTYSTRGNLQTVTGSYGPIVSSVSDEADGRPDSMVYADAAKTTTAYSYNNPKRLLSQVLISRAGSFPSATSTYTPPAANAAQPTQQKLLADDVTVLYDGVNNPLLTMDERNVAEWPAGARPVTSQTYAYDDSYRLKSVTNTYSGGSDPYVPPIASNMPDTSPVPMSTTPAHRVVSQTFAYDGLGNLIGSTDDANIFLERSLGKVVINNNLNTSSGGPNQLLSSSLTTTSGVGGNLSASYDYAGNLAELSVARGGACTGALPCSQRYQYTWDEVGQLSSATRFDYYPPPPCSGRFCPQITGTYRQAAQVQYAYDSGGRRVLRSGAESSGITTYSAEIFPSLRLNHATWDSSSSTYERTSDTEAVYLSIGGSVYGRVVYDTAAPSISGPLHILLEITDQMTSTAIVVDRDTSELVERTTYLAYGAIDSDYRPDRWQNFREDYKFTGKEEDVEVGLTYFGARYYSAPLGRWISPDPLAIHAGGGDLNPYAYVHGRVTTATDPTGLADGLGGAVVPAEPPVVPPITIPEVTVVGDPTAFADPSIPTFGTATLGGQSEPWIMAPGVDPASINPFAMFESSSFMPPGDWSSGLQTFPLSLEGTIYAPEANPYYSQEEVARGFVSPIMPWISAPVSFSGPYVSQDEGFGYGHMVGSIALSAVTLPFGGSGALTRATTAGGFSTAADGVEAAGASRAIAPYWPANNGFLGSTTSTTLEAGTTIDRFGGSSFSRFFSPTGTRLAARAVPAETAAMPLRTFRVLRPLTVESGAVAPAFGQLGMGTQFRTSLTLGELLEQGLLEEVH